MKIALSTLFAILLSTSFLLGQKEHTPVLSTIGYANFLIGGSELLHKIPYDDEGKLINFYRPTIGLIIRNPETRRSLEMELTIWKQIAYVRGNPNLPFTDWFNGLRLEYGKHNFFWLGKRQVHYRLNLSAQFFVSDGVEVERVYGSNPTRYRDRIQKRYGVIVGLIPHLEIPLGERLFIDLNTGILQLSFFNWQDGKYVLRKEVTKRMSEYLIRFGVGYHIL